MNKSSRAKRAAAKRGLSTPTPLRWALAAGVVQAALWLAASGYIIYGSQDCIELTCFGESLAVVFFIPVAILLLVLLIYDRRLRSTSRSLTIVLEGMYVLAALLFTYSLITNWSSLLSDNGTVTTTATALFLLLAIVLPCVVIVGLVQCAPTFESAERQRPNRDLRRKLGMVFLGQAAGACKVSEVVPMSSAHDSGVQVGDTVTGVNGEAIDTALRLVFLIRNMPRSQPISLTIRGNDGSIREVRLARSSDRVSLKAAAAIVRTDRERR